MRRTPLLSLLVLGAVVAGSVITVATASPGPRAARAANTYKVKRLVADQAGQAKTKDPNLINAWGLAAGPTTPWWVNAADADVSTLYDGKGNIVPLVVDVTGGPTGIVFNGGSGFVVTNSRGYGTGSGPSVFLFATEAGTIRGWNPNVPMPSPSTQTFVVADRSSAGADYKGLAIASTAGGDMLYATDFHNGRVDMFNSSFALVGSSSTFVDPHLPPRFAPFGIRAIGDTIFVTYAKQDADAEDEVAGSGLGFVDAFDTAGAFIGRVASRHALDAPWGLAMAPSGFGKFSDALLVGNFGDGRIHAFRPTATGSFEMVGTLHNRHGKTLVVDGLWAIAFGNGDAAGPSNALYFTAGPGDEQHGLFGSIRMAT